MFDLDPFVFRVWQLFGSGGLKMVIFICLNAGLVLTQQNFLCLFAHYLGFLHGISCLKIF